MIWHSDMLLPPSWVKDEFNSKANRWWEAQMATLLFCPRDDIVQQAENLKVNKEFVKILGNYLHIFF